MHYYVDAKKDITDRGKRKTNNNMDKVNPKIAYLEDIYIAKEWSLKKKKKVIKEAIKDQGLELNPHKFDIEKEEEICVKPNAKVKEKTRRLRPSIFRDTYETIKIPEKARKEWKLENKEAIEFRKNNGGEQHD